MSSIMIFLFVVSLFCLSEVMTFCLKNKINYAVTFVFSFVLYITFIIFCGVIDINLLSASKIFWYLYLSIPIISFITLLFLKKINLNYMRIVFLTVSILSAFILMYFSNAYMSQVALLPLSTNIDGIGTAINYINNSVHLSTANYLTLFYTSCISLLPNSVSFTTINPIVINFMQFILLFLLIDFFIAELNDSFKCKKFELLVALICCLPFLLGYEVLKFGFTNQVYLFLFVLVCFDLLFNTEINLCLKAIALIGVLFVFNLHVKGIIYLVFTILVAIYSSTNFKSRKVHITKFLVLIIFAGYAIYGSLNGSNNFVELIKPNQQNLFIPYFNFDCHNIFVTGLITIFLVVSVRSFNKAITIISVVLIIIVIPTNFVTNNASYLASFQYILFNPFVLGALFNFTWIDEKYRASYLYGTLLLSMFALTFKGLVNPYHIEFDNYNNFYRMENDEAEVYNYLYANYDFSNEVKLISQAPNSQRYLPNVSVIDSFREQLTRCQYCDVYEMNLHEPSNLVNIFAFREFGGNVLFIEQPYYENGCNLLNEHNIDLLILRQDQTIEVNGEWYKLADYYLQCNSKIYENSTYVVLKRN